MVISQVSWLKAASDTPWKQWMQLYNFLHDWTFIQAKVHFPPLPSLPHPTTFPPYPQKAEPSAHSIIFQAFSSCFDLLQGCHFDVWSAVNAMYHCSLVFTCKSPVNWGQCKGNMISEWTMELVNWNLHYSLNVARWVFLCLLLNRLLKKNRKQNHISLPHLLDPHLFFASSCYRDSKPHTFTSSL